MKTLPHRSPMLMLVIVQTALLVILSTQGLVRSQLARKDDPGEEASRAMQQAYARLVLNEVLVTPAEIRISGSKAVLARSAANGMDGSPAAVLSSVRSWRAREDSNL